MDDRIKNAITRVRFGSHVDANVLADECERLQELVQCDQERLDAEIERDWVQLEKSEARVTELERRLSQYECPLHTEPKFGECDECDKHCQDEEWRNPQL